MAEKPADEDESRNPQTRGSVETIFYLYTDKVKAASIFWKECGTNSSLKQEQMTKTHKDKDGKIWMAKICSESNSAADVEYYYTLERKSKDPAVEENRRKTRQGSTTYDSFCDETHAHLSQHAAVCYSKRLFESVDEKTFKDHVLATENMNFNFRELDSEVLKKYVNWIFSQKTDGNEPQCFYLAVLLARVNENNDFDWQKKTKEQLWKDFADNFLSVIRVHEQIPKWFDPETNLYYLHILAAKLVNACSVPGWLTYAASFYTYLGTRHILSVHFTSTREYTQQEYEELVGCLIQHITTKDRKDVSKDFLKIIERILLDAPNYEAIITLYGLNRFLNLFENSDDEKKLFEKVFGEKAKDVLRGTNLSEALNEIAKIPDKPSKPIKASISKRILLDFVELPPQVSSHRHQAREENSHAFWEELSRENYLDTEDIKTVLAALVTSNQQRCHVMFLDLFKSKFYETWGKFEREQHISILSKWVAADLADNPNKQFQCQPQDVFERAEELKSSKTITQDVIQEACSKGFERKNLKNVTVASMLHAIATVEKLSQPIQNIYEETFRTFLENSPSIKQDVVDFSKSKSWFTDRSQRKLSSLAENLLVKVLDWLENTKKGGHHENNFLELIEWSRLWETLLTAEGSTQAIEKHKAFVTAKESLQALFSSLHRKEISIQVFKYVERHKHILDRISARLTNKAKNNFNKEREACLKTLKEFDAKSDAIESAIMICRYISEKVKIPISDIAAVTSALEKCKSDKQSVKDLESNVTWGTSFFALSLSMHVKKLRESASFKNVAKRCLRDRKALAEMTFSDFLKFLVNDCIKMFRSEWYDFLKTPESDEQTLQNLENLIGQRSSAENLEKEIDILQAYFEKFPQKLKNYLLAYGKHDQILAKVEITLSALKIVGFYDGSLAVINTLESFTRQVQNKAALSVKKHYDLVQNIQKLLTFGSLTESVLQQLNKSSEVVKFVQKSVNEDLHFMIEEIDEHQEQLKVTASLVTELIEVHQFVGSIIKQAKSNSTVKTFLHWLDKFVTKKDIGIVETMMGYIESCNDNISSLDGLYKSVTNRVEISKGVIKNCLEKGKYSVYVNKNGECIAKISYEDINGEHFLPALQNLRSRAYLISNTAKNKLFSGAKPTSATKRPINYTEFIRQIDLLTEICDLLTQIRPLEFKKYDKVVWKDLQGTANLREKLDELKKDLKEWQTALAEGRNEFFFLNFYRSSQLRFLYQFFDDSSNKKNYNEALSLFKIIDPGIEWQVVRRKLNELQQNENAKDYGPHALVRSTGDTLDAIFKDTQSRARPLILPVVGPSSTEYFVKEGEIFVVKLDEESLQTANVMLALYANTCKSFPQPHEIMFCNSKTKMEEVNLLLNRCTFYRKKEQEPEQRKSLHCIANVDLLQPKIILELAKILAVKFNVKNQQSKSRLAIICRGKKCNQIFEEFNEYTHQVNGLTDTALSTCLKKEFPEVVVYTSALPGLGKTERIKTEACQKGKNIITCPVHDSVDWNKLVARLKSLPVKSYYCIHFDIGHVDNPSLLDSFLFQLIVIGMVSSETGLFHLPTNHLYIEIANTLKDSLRDSLQICKYFKSERVNVFNYDDLMVSSDVNSNVQIVCQYLSAHHRKILEVKDIFVRDVQCPEQSEKCRELLSEYFPNKHDISFNILRTFLAVLADQLRKFSESPYFKVSNLKAMLGGKGREIRTNLLMALVDVSKEFASRSIRTCALKNGQFSASKSTIKAMMQRVEGMKQWEHSNHPLLVFHGRDAQTATAIYRNKIDVPAQMRELLSSQATQTDHGSQDIPDYSSMSADELREKLVRIASTQDINIQQDDNPDPSYVLTHDNIHKMILIILRVRGRIPVILMGETGCGKTSLVRYLATTCKIPFHVFNLHAGIHEQQIIRYIEKKEMQVREEGKEMWIFLDEINTTDHLGLITEIMCHHSLLGRPLPKKLVFLAACNPYKLRPEKHLEMAGLEGKSTSDEYSRLVYRVHPLPEAMIDYVWDFGFLNDKDEMSYIQRMVGSLKKVDHTLIAKLLAVSQKFVREHEGNFGVSLRDIKRCIGLIEWFQETLVEISKYPIPNERKLQALDPERQEWGKCPSDLKSCILGLAHCYMYRLSTTKLRDDYRRKIVEHLKCKQITEQMFTAVVRIMEDDFLNRMTLPPETCKNNSLRENVFVMLVCILKRIPIFVVGKPGCSKSLSMRLIKSNLRGRDSLDPYFKTLPHIYVISYQSSESSTSEGIEKAFEKARKYAECNKDILPVVLLDEVGLAGCSKHNPLKVLHSLLEPEISIENTKPGVAVVGISNWTLDAAKMNRAIHLSKPDPDVEDLHNTALSIMCERRGLDTKSLREQVRHIAESYHKYQSTQMYSNFHGLRDYYSLIKNLNNGNLKLQPHDKINLALQRNFGGLLESEIRKIQVLFLKNPPDDPTDFQLHPVTKLIQENLQDPHARHLMLFANGNSALDILANTLHGLNREVVTIYGSHFDEDQSEEYNYRVLGQILLCMERSCILILRDLDLIYGALYDMLNQSYTIVDGKKICRVAIGADSNPTCLVHEEFRCVVLKDDKEIDFSDPPFLNRFEKQLLRFSNVLTKEQEKTVEKLKEWVEEISGIKGLSGAFGPPDMFISFHEDTLNSLVFSHAECRPNEDLFDICKADLIWIASPEAVVRAKRSKLFERAPEEIESITKEYFDKPLHDGLAHFINAVKRVKHPYLAGDEIGSKCVVMTYSSSSMTRTVDEKCQVEFLSSMNSEKQLKEAVASFWKAEDYLLIVHCFPDIDGANILLARSIIESERKRYKMSVHRNDNAQKKHVIILIHIKRQHCNNSKATWQFTFCSGWKQIFLDVLEEQEISLRRIHSASIQTMLKESIWPLEQIAQEVLWWCFSCIEYTREQRDLDSISRIVNNLFESENVSRVLEELVNEWLSLKSNECFQADIACNKEQLVNSSTFVFSLKQRVFNLVRVPLAKTIYFMENNNAWPPHLSLTSSDGREETMTPKLETLWCKLIRNSEILEMEKIPDPLKYGVYKVDTVMSDLQFPFSHLIIKRFEGEVKGLFLDN